MAAALVTTRRFPPPWFVEEIALVPVAAGQPAEPPIPTEKELNQGLIEFRGGGSTLDRHARVGFSQGNRSRTFR